MPQSCQAALLSTAPQPSRRREDDKGKSMKPDTFGCVGSTIKTAAGNYIDLLAPTLEAIDIETIAHALSMTCRFGGHCPQFYSVAEHCVHAFRLAERDRVDVNDRRAILLHDAAEAYVGDVVKPLKVILGAVFCDIENAIDAKIRERFAVASARPIIKHYDCLMLIAEKTAMWPDDAEEWEGFRGLSCPDVDLQYWRPDWARRQFLTCFDEVSL